MSLCVPRESGGAHGSQKRALDLLELALEVVVSHPTWVLGTRPRGSARAASALNH